ncbi:MAG: hypothetical protein L6R42_003429 [Xanthoria sp. 1 TBL-2021]|nr:MAG: hypothetical protein L6R42_003429 [Xanthoria sp. 1 TBL-2021]
MDPLSITASVITVADAAHRIVKYILDVKNASSDLCNLMTELQSLRNELENFANLSKRAEINCDSESTSKLPMLQQLTDLGNSSSPLACCHQQLKTLVEELERAEWGPLGSKRDASVKAVKWPSKQKEITKTRERMNNLMKSLSSGLRYDEVNLAMDTNTRVRSVDRQAQSIQEDLKQDQIIKWLNAPDAALSHHQASEKRGAETTGRWFIDSGDYAKWKVEPHSIYWLHGILGCGKTILASTIIDDLSKCCAPSPSTLAYFYCSDRQDCAQILRSLLRQLASQSRECLEMLAALYFGHDKGLKHPSRAALSTCLRSMVGLYGTTFIVLDALDECKSRGELMDLIENIDSWREADYHILVTSRSELDIRATVESLSHKKYIINVQESPNAKDILTHIRYRLSHDRSLRRWQKDPEALRETEVQLMEKSDGMFLLTDHQLDALRNCHTKDMLMATLRSLPATLNERYAQILGNIDIAHRKLAIKTFQWIIYSEGPINLDEMADILAIDVAADPGFDASRRRLVEPEEVIRICCNLINVGRLGQKDIPEFGVRFAHLSVKEYLLSNQVQAGPMAYFSLQYLDAHSIIAQDCLICLSHVKDVCDVKGRKLFGTVVAPGDRLTEMSILLRCKSAVKFQEEVQSALPLLQYASKYWTEHVRSAGEKSEPLFQLMVEAFEPDTFEAWYLLRRIDSLPGEYPYESVPIVELAPARLTYAIEKGLPRLAQHMLDQGIEVNFPLVHCRTPLQAAASLGNLELVKSLLKCGASVNLSVGIYGSPISFAASGGFTEVVEFLLDEGADFELMAPPSSGYSSNTALMAVAEENHLSIARILIARGANVDTTTHTVMANGHIYTALNNASDGGHTEMVQLLLSCGASIALDANKDALRAAARRGHEDTTALQCAAQYGKTSTLRLLIDWRADVNIQTHSRFGTALQAASFRGRIEAVQVLLESGADVTTRGGEYESALKAACISGEESIIRVLMQHGADVNEPSDSFGSPLQCAAQEGRTAAIRFLLDNGADVNQQGGKWNNALEAALEKGYGYAAHQLLAAGADENVKKELRQRLEDVRRGVDNLLWRRDTWAERACSPDGIFRLPDRYYFDKSLLNNAVGTFDTWVS